MLHTICTGGLVSVIPAVIPLPCYALPPYGYMQTGVNIYQITQGLDFDYTILRQFQLNRKSRKTTLKRPVKVVLLFGLNEGTHSTQGSRPRGEEEGGGGAP